MKITFFISLLCTIISASQATAKQVPDFSGEWILSKEKSSLQLKALEKLEKAVAVIDHKDPHFRLSRVFTIDGQDDSLTLELMADGKERSSQEKNQTHYSRLYWDGDTLVFVTRIVAPQGEATNTVRYQLRENGTVLQAKEIFRGPRLKYDNLWVFVKKQEDRI